MAVSISYIIMISMNHSCNKIYAYYSMGMICHQIASWCLEIGKIIGKGGVDSFDVRVVVYGMCNFVACYMH